MHATTDDNSQRQKSCFKFIQVMRISAVLILTLSLVGLLKKPNSLHLPTSLWIHSSPTALTPELFPIAIFAAYFWLCQWLCLLYSASVEAAIPTAVVNTLDLLTYKGTDIHAQQKWNAVMKEMRKLELLLNEYSQMFGPGIFYGELVQVCIVILSSYAGMRSNGIISLRSFTVALALSWVGHKWLGMLADVFEQSRRTLKSWKCGHGSVQAAPIFQKFLKATRPMRVSIGFFYADRMLVLTVGGVILQNTATLLLSTTA